MKHWLIIWQSLAVVEASQVYDWTAASWYGRQVVNDNGRRKPQHSTMRFTALELRIACLTGWLVGFGV